MPFTIHDQAVKKQMNWNVMRPQEAAPDPLPENWSGTMSGGLPVKQIPHLEFPRVVYMHPKKTHKQIEHRNDKFEVVGIEVVPTIHKTKLVNNEAELKQALAQGWRKEPYIPAPPPSTEDGVYDDDEVALPPTPKRSTRGTAENPL